MRFTIGINNLFIYLPGFVLCLFSACQPNHDSEKHDSFDKEKVKQQFVKANQQVVVKENDEMDYYQKSHNMPFIKTTGGIRYYVYAPSAKGDSIKTDDIITINYTVFLLDGTECYSSKTDGAKEFKVGMENIENGLHKAVLFLKSGDKARILIPSHLAHGLLGDSKKIPPQSPILYDLEILSVKKQQQN
ncbi:MAG: peptidylprolyl isomerase [Bacteroidetes bacterium]|jgi:FKBP-type peptidyl-prolyl cis-trans isomerase|nr:peptidylprolyl isomerase [Bacteroidota bacterium]MDF2453314.1 peptidylprolyl isomerase [Bacteroidota bacterium]